jgi:subtilisin family serine protease
MWRLSIPGSTGASRPQRGGGVSFSGGDSEDGNGHGTHVAGTVGANDNGSGVVGVAPGVRVWAVKVCKNGGICMTGDIAAGFDWVAARKADFKSYVAGGVNFASANMSISKSDKDTACNTGSVPAVQRAICGAVDEGVVVVIAAGNDGREKKAYPEAVAVSALADFDGKEGGKGSPTCRSDTDDRLASFSNYGPSVDIAAPGVCITSTWKGGKYNTISGTSMAAQSRVGDMMTIGSLRFEGVSGHPHTPGGSRLMSFGATICRHNDRVQRQSETVRWDEMLASLEEAKNGLIDDRRVCDRAHVTQAFELDNLYLRQRLCQQPSHTA